MKRDFLALIRGERRGPLPALARAALRVASWLFAVAVAVRALAYAVGLARSHRASIPVISIGNLTTGGTGKTPLAILVASHLVGRGERPAVIARGYGAARDGELNDELRLVQARVPGARVYAGADRVASAARAEADGCTCVVLDDGFQHRRLARDVDVVVVDATDPWGAGALLPRGLLREPVTALRRAHEVVISRTDLVPEGAVGAVRERLAAAGVTAPVTTMRTVPARVVSSAATLGESTATLDGKRVHLLSAIGNPAAFRATVERLGARVEGESVFPDHHAYRHDEVARVLDAAGEALVITTEKDAVKLAGLDGAERVRALAIEPRLEPEGALLARLETALVAARRRPRLAPRALGVARETLASLATT